jgi:hypothetical protein
MTLVLRASFFLSVPSSFQTKIVTQTFIDLSLHCYHCRKTQQLRVGKGHTSERPISTCLIFINFFLKFSSKSHFCFGSPLFLFAEKHCRTMLGKVTQERDRGKFLPLSPSLFF